MIAAAMDLAAPVQFVKGVGPQRAAALQKLGVVTTEDLLLHLPMRYEDRRSFVKVAALAPGMRVAVSGRIAVAGLRRARRLSLFEIRLDDGTGLLKALWFNQPYLQDVLQRDLHVVLFGAIEKDGYGRQVMMSSPQYEVMDAEETTGLHTGRIVPIYEKLGPLSGKTLRRVLHTLAQDVPGDLPDPLPEDLRHRLSVIGRGAALRRVHAPEPEDLLGALNAARSDAHRRLILEELFLFQVGLAVRKQGLQRETRSRIFRITDKTREAVKRILPFRLTGAQKRVLKEIADDLQSPHPMHRLVQGDVGSGKTMVALLAMVVAVENGFQAAFMAPTEILAEQHFMSLKHLLSRCSYSVDLLTAARKGKEKTAAFARLASGETHIAVGTHALIQEGVTFSRLGLAVVDEQHRFGVLQRDELRKKGREVDVLVMTATPIPRTLSLTVYGDLDVSLLDERPPGRTPIVTRLCSESDRRAVVDEVRRAVSRGEQAYVVYPLVQESEKLEDVRAATEMAAVWQDALPAVRVGLLHGRMKSAEKEAAMGAFSAGDTQVLVATTVIEVGVDVKNASVMVIEHADRFGLAQLHQLRGRVGRGRAASTCVLVSDGKLTEDARERLAVMAESDDGFVLAEKDLEIRGPGDFFGTRQAGLPTLRVANLVRDRELLEEARREAFAYVDARTAGEPLPGFLEPGAWERRFGLARVG